MDFTIARKGNENLHKYPTEDMRLARKFSSILEKELKDFLMGVVVFGSSVRREKKEGSDIDIMIVTNDLDFAITKALVEGYKLIVEKAVVSVSPKFHITSMTYSSFWEHSRNGDPVIVNILRDGVAVYDRGFFVPMQRLLKQGRIRPSEESIWLYYSRSPQTLINSRWHLLQATFDLYWAVIDAAHAALMRAGKIPPSPDHVASLLNETFVKKRKLEKKYVETMNKFYKLSKLISHRQLERVTGPEYEAYYKEADAFVKRMKKLIDVRF